MSQNNVVVSDIDAERGVGQGLNNSALQLNHVALSQASYLLGITELIPEDRQGLPDFTVQHRLAVFHAAGNRGCSEPRGNNVLSPFFLWSLNLSAFPVHQPEKVTLFPAYQEKLIFIVTGCGSHNVTFLERHTCRSLTWVRISGSPFVMRIEFS